MVDFWESLAERYRSTWVEELCSAVGIGRPSGSSKAEMTKLEMNAAARLAELEEAVLPETVFTRNLAILSEHIGLSSLESELLGMAVLFNTQDWLYNLTEQACRRCSDESAIRFLARVVRAPAIEVRRCLSSPDAKLTRSGLLHVLSGRMDLPDKLEMLPGLVEALFTPSESPLEALTSRCLDKGVAKLQAEDFAHLESEFELVEQLVRKAARDRTPGINVLIYGSPGTGKTQFVRALAAKAGLDLWEVGHKGSEGNDASGRERLMHLRLSQTLLAEQSQAVILFDEFEDVLVPEEKPFTFRPPRKVPKAVLNNMVETNRVPTFWISNEPFWLEDATQRRFTHAFKMPAPPRSVNERIFAAELSRFGLGADWASRVSADERLVPAYAERARRVLEHAEPADPDAAARIAEQVLSGCVSLTPQGGRLRKETADAAGYRLGFLNADCNLRVLSGGIARTGQGRICLAGPPGTGKSAYARYLAHRLGRHLLLRRSSDLLGMFVGQTEERIALAFAKGERDGAVLLIDEMEGLLQSRSGAQRSWEVTQVNEMLTQLESYQGVFIATTNLAHTFDLAAQRRFDAFVQFDYLRPAQALVLLREMIAKASGERPTLTPVQRRRLAAVPNLTPGDFAAVGRRAKLFGRLVDTDWWIAALERDATAKPDAPRATLGFLAAVS
ncbi:MAG: AAA family ATPase [Gammaproteobacteria bacterium]